MFTAGDEFTSLTSDRFASISESPRRLTLSCRNWSPLLLGSLLFPLGVGADYLQQLWLDPCVAPPDLTGSIVCFGLAGLVLGLRPLSDRLIIDWDADTVTLRRRRGYVGYTRRLRTRDIYIAVAPCSLHQRRFWRGSPGMRRWKGFGCIIFEDQMGPLFAISLRHSMEEAARDQASLPRRLLSLVRDTQKPIIAPAAF